MKNRKNEVQRWLEFADEDMHMAKLALKDDIHNQVCFHAQQCVEKILKALLVHNQHNFPKTHDLKELYKMCEAANILDVVPFKNETWMLSLFYLPTRYPDALVGSLPDRLPTGKDAKSALEAAQAIYNQLSKGLLK